MVAARTHGLPPSTAINTDTHTNNRRVSYADRRSEGVRRFCHLGSAG